MNNTLIKITLSIVVVLLLGCTTKSNKINSTIFVDIEQSKSINIKPDMFLKLDTSAMIGLTKKIYIEGNKCLIFSTDKLMLFDLETGNYERKFLNKGRAKNEYISIWDFWVDENKMINLYDMNGKKVFRFTFNQDELSVNEINPSSESSPFQILSPYKNGYIGRRVYMGKNTIPELAQYDEEFKFMNNIESFNLESGLFLGDPFFKYGDVLLYNRYFRNDIYEVMPSGVKVRYLIDFMSNNIPKDKDFTDEYERIDFLNSGSVKYASLISKLYESDTYFCFSFLYDARKYLCVYDKNSKTTSSYYFESQNKKLLDLHIVNNRAYLFFQDDITTYVYNVMISELNSIINI